MSQRSRARSRARMARGGARPTRSPSRPPRSILRDKHKLYEIAVQDVAMEAKLLDRLYAKLRGRPARLLREDFCGTALLCAEWVRDKPARSAIGLDLNPEVLAWAREHNVLPLGDDAARVRLMETNVLSPPRDRADIVVAFNFSYLVFKSRELLLRYFKTVRRGLAKDGIFVLDLFGGYETHWEKDDRRRYSGFTYVWNQERINPVDGSFRAHIHFELADGTKIRRAFSYDWRLWQLSDIRDLLRDAGFESARVYTDPKDTGTHRFVDHMDADACWNCYIVAS